MTGFAMVLLVGLFAFPLPGAPAADPPVRGVDVSDRLGIGVAVAEAPLGVRYLWDRRYGVDLGLGFRSEAVDGDRANTMVIDGAFLYAMAPGERVNTFIRAGVQFRNRSFQEASSTTIRLSGFAEFELFLNDSFSVGARTGFFVENTSRPEGADDIVDFGVGAGRVTEAGFHFYLDR